MPRLSVVMCTRNRADLIGRAVASVLANHHDSFDLHVIDQSTDRSTELALAGQISDSRLNYVHVERAGLSAAYNYGISLTSAPLLAFTDDDCVAPAHWLKAIEGAFERHADVGLIYGQTISAPSMSGEPGVIPDLVFRREEKLGKGYGFKVYGMGANFALRRSLSDALGGFDEALGGGGPLRSSQDFDFQYRAFRAGAITLLSPDVWVDHYGIREGSAWANTLSAYGAGDGAFYLKHVRCGDIYALSLLTKILVRMAGREILNPIRKRPSKWQYLRSCLDGMRASLDYKIDRSTRLYQMNESAA